MSVLPFMLGLINCFFELSIVARQGKWICKVLYAAHCELTNRQTALYFRCDLQNTRTTSLLASLVVHTMAATSLPL